MADPGISELGSAVEFLESGDCFDAPSHVPYVFVVSVEKKYILYTFTTIKVQGICVLSLKIYKTNPKILFKQGVHGLCAEPGWPMLSAL